MSYDSEEQESYEQYCLDTYQIPEADDVVGEYGYGDYPVGEPSYRGYGHKPVSNPTHDEGWFPPGRRFRRRAAEQRRVTNVGRDEDRVESTNRYIEFKKTVAYLHHMWEMEDKYHVQNMETFRALFEHGSPIMEINQSEIIDEILEMRDEDYKRQKLKRGEVIHGLNEHRLEVDLEALTARLRHDDHPYQNHDNPTDPEFDIYDSGLEI